MDLSVETGSVETCASVAATYWSANMRQLKHHEKKLLKKVDFLKWKNEDNLRELQVSIICY